MFVVCVCCSLFSSIHHSSVCVCFVAGCLVVVGIISIALLLRATFLQQRAEFISNFLRNYCRRKILFTVQTTNIDIPSVLFFCLSDVCQAVRPSPTVTMEPCCIRTVSYLQYSQVALTNTYGTFRYFVFVTETVFVILFPTNYKVVY